MRGPVHSAAIGDGSSNGESLWRGAGLLTLCATFLLMWLGAFTRASMAGISCPDWPLCHGYLVPPLNDGAYPPAPMYTAYKVYLEFGHRVLAALVAVGALVVGVRAYRTKARPIALALWSVLGLQILAGAVTVWLSNRPLTVVLHLLLALCFVTLLLALRTRTRAVAPSAARLTRVELPLAVLVLIQLLIGAGISSARAGLACPGFPLCFDGGGLLPIGLTAPMAWQLLHRLLALVLAVSLLAAFGQRLCLGELEPLRRVSFALLLLFAQILLGAANVWLRVPPWSSALHLAVGAGLFALLVYPLTAVRLAGSRPPQAHAGEGE